MHPLILAAALCGQFVLAPQTPPPNPSPTPQAAAAVPTPQGWGPPPAAAAAPAAFPVAAVAPAPPPLYSIVLQAAPPVAAASPVFAPASSQFSPASSPYVNPFVVQQAPVQAQQGIGAIALTVGTVLVDNPWIFDRIAAHIGEHLVKRGHPRIIIPPPGSPAIPATPTAPLGSSAAPVYLATPAGTVQAVPVAHHRTAFARWFWGE